MKLLLQLESEVERISDVSSLDAPNEDKIICLQACSIATWICKGIFVEKENGRLVLAHPDSR